MTILLTLALLSAAAENPDDYRLANPRAIELFEADQRLMRWALAQHDANGDGELSILEADKAAL